jgi:hypothetical protein
MSIQTVKTGLLALSLLIMAQLSYGQTGRDIMLKVDERPDGDTRKSVMTMELISVHP